MDTMEIIIYFEVISLLMLPIAAGLIIAVKCR